jgi:hypothetical protein
MAIIELTRSIKKDHACDYGNKKLASISHFQYFHFTERI